jgi:Holliday junction resolvasome RuvABC DNA-binding subunit
MIARLEGIIVHTTEKFLIIDVSGVGYKILAPITLLLSLQKFC